MSLRPFATLMMQFILGPGLQTEHVLLDPPGTKTVTDIE